MHMADALISPAVGGAMLAISAGVAVFSAKKLQINMDEKNIPLMGVMGAFVFAAQMINFSIPGTGASGHLGGGMLLSILLGPYAGFLAMASILLIQALFFGDGGLLAYGCNLFNLGFYTCFVAYPFIYKWITRQRITSQRILWGAIISGIIGLQLGAFSVALETLVSGRTELPFTTFVLLMQPIHLVIGLVEGVVTAAIITYVWKVRPEILGKVAFGKAMGNIPLKKVLTGLIIATVIIGGIFSWGASSNPDGLEWAITRTAGISELEGPGGIHQTLLDLQRDTALMPDYNFTTGERESVEKTTTESTGTGLVADAGTSIAGLVGGALTLVMAAFIGFAVSLVKRKGSRVEA